jgi:hypothetical protein
MCFLYLLKLCFVPNFMPLNRVKAEVSDIITVLVLTRSILETYLLAKCMKTQIKFFPIL